MQLILAIDSDPRRSEQLANLVRARLQVDLVQATSAGEGLHALKERVPDLILTSPLLSPFDDGVLDEYLRDLGAAATHVQTVRIPVLSTGPRRNSAAKRLFSLGRKKAQTSSAAPDGCDPKVFADEIAHYLTRSLEERSASAKAAADRPVPPGSARTPNVASEMVIERQVDEWNAPEALVQDFRETMPAAPETVFEASPGSILDLRTPIVHAPEARVVQPERAVFRKAEPIAFVEPETPVFVEPEPFFDPAQGEPLDLAQSEPLGRAQSEPLDLYVEPEPAVHAEPVLERVNEPAPLVDPAQSKPAAISASVIAAPAPASAAPATGNSASFEAALAAIRAAWAKPEPKTPPPAGPVPPASATKPLAGSGEVDLTNQIDGLEDVTAVDGATATTDDGSPEDSKAPDAHRNGAGEKARKQPEKPRGRKTRGADDRDDWGVFDPNKYEFSALVNKLDEVTDSDEVTTRATNSR